VIGQAPAVTISPGCGAVEGGPHQMLNQLGSADQIGHDLADLCLHHRSHGAACGSSRPGRCGPVDLPLPAVRAQERLLRSGGLRASLGRPLRAGLWQLGRSAARLVEVAPR
jgi:hypothetical protein